MPCNIFGRTSEKCFRELSTSRMLWGPGILAGESTARGRPDQNCAQISPTCFPWTGIAAKEQLGQQALQACRIDIPNLSFARRRIPQVICFRTYSHLSLAIQNLLAKFRQHLWTAGDSTKRAQDSHGSREGASPICCSWNLHTILARHFTLYSFERRDILI